MNLVIICCSDVHYFFQNCFVSAFISILYSGFFLCWQESADLRTSTSNKNSFIAEQQDEKKINRKNIIPFVTLV